MQPRRFGRVANAALLGLGLLLLALAGGLAWWQRPDPARPALWLVEGAGGQRAYLFGTIHALPRPAAWRHGAVAQALAKADLLVVEVANLDDSAGMARSFAALAHSAGLPAPEARVAPALRPALQHALAASGKNSAELASLESWAIALLVAREASHDNPAYGVDRALLADHGGLPVVELEGAFAQFSMFYRLPESAQRKMLELALQPEAGSDQTPDLAKAWREGNLPVLAAQTRSGLLAEQVLHEALYAARNRAWTAALAGMMTRGAHPFVAVGAAHLAGTEGLPALLQARGYRLQRLQ